MASGKSRPAWPRPLRRPGPSPDGDRGAGCGSTTSVPSQWVAGGFLAGPTLEQRGLVRGRSSRLAEHALFRISKRFQPVFKFLALLQPGPGSQLCQRAGCARCARNGRHGAAPCCGRDDFMLLGRADVLEGGCLAVSLSEAWAEPQDSACRTPRHPQSTCCWPGCRACARQPSPCRNGVPGRAIGSEFLSAASRACVRQVPFLATAAIEHSDPGRLACIGAVPPGARREGFFLDSIVDETMPQVTHLPGESVRHM